MELLTGQYNNTLDEKGRISFPSKLRAGIDTSTVWVTQSLDRCLWLFTPEEWNSFKAKVMESASPFNQKNRLVLRHLIAPAQEVEFDKSGRLSIPQSLRDYAGLAKDCVILAIDKYVELWDSAAFEAYNQANEQSLIEAAEELNAITF